MSWAPRNVEVVECCSVCGILERVPMQLDPSWDEAVALAGRAVGGLPHRTLGCGGTVAVSVDPAVAHRSVVVPGGSFRDPEC